MDYGPTIAAAFGSYNPREVDELREALVECMRNTPTTGGVRATGAVRQPNPQPYQQRPPQQQNYATDPSERRRDYPGDNGQQQKPPANNQAPPPTSAASAEVSANESVAEEADLLDVDNWDDMPSQVPDVMAGSTQLYGQPNIYAPAPQQQPAYGYNPTQAQPQPSQNIPQQQFAGQPQGYPAQQSPYAAAVQPPQDPFGNQLYQQQQQSTPQGFEAPVRF